MSGSFDVAARLSAAMCIVLGLAAGSAYNLGGLYADGRGVPKDASRAAALFKQACQAGISEGCAAP